MTGQTMELTGKLLVAMPGMGDPRFAHSVIYLSAHSEQGAMGLMVNKPAPELRLSDVLDQLVDDTPPQAKSLAVHFGGPVETGRGFVLHGADYRSDLTTLQVDDTFCMTGTLDVLEHIARGDGPSQWLAMLGYAGWGPGQLEQELALEYEYGVTADWTVKAEIPLVDKDSNGNGSTGIGNMVLGTKYRFLRVDLPGMQYSTTLLFQAKLPTDDDDRNPRLGSGSTDFVGGLLHGLESRRWYYNTAARYRLNTEGGGDLEKGDKVFLDIVGGVRPVLTGYKEPDTVLFLELNFENAERDTLRGSDVANTGGWELFLSPGVFWTYRTYAVTAGVQIPVAENLNGTQATSDYRFKLSMKYEF